MNNERRFDVIKRYAAEEFTNKVRIGSPFPTEAQFLALVAATQSPNAIDPRKLVDEWHAAGLSYIENWDVRMVGKLIECFPGCVPKHWHGRKLTAYMADTEDCHWVVGVA